MEAIVPVLVTLAVGVVLFLLAILIGGGVRDIHKKSQMVLRDHLTLEPIMAGQEEQTVEVPPGFDPSAIRLTGNVTGQPPFRGVLKHHGWRVKAYKLPAPAAGVDEL